MSSGNRKQAKAIVFTMNREGSLGSVNIGHVHLALSGIGLVTLRLNFAKGAGDFVKGVRSLCPRHMLKPSERRQLHRSSLGSCPLL